jgi:hypothetical protein
LCVAASWSITPSQPLLELLMNVSIASRAVSPEAFQ